MNRVTGFPASARLILAAVVERIRSAGFFAIVAGRLRSARFLSGPALGNRLRARARRILVVGSAACLAGGVMVLAASVGGGQPEGASLSVHSWPSLFEPLSPPLPNEAGLPGRPAGGSLPKLDLRSCAAAFSIPVSTVPPAIKSLLDGVVPPTPSSTTSTSVAPTPVYPVPRVSTPLGPLPVSPGEAIAGLLQSIFPQPGALAGPASQSGDGPGPASGGSTATATKAPGIALGLPGGLGSFLDMTGGTCIPLGLESAASLGSSPAQADALDLAENQLGTPYVWGGEAKNAGFDCSGLVQWAFSAAGVALPRGAQAQFDSGPAVPWGAKVVPGDLVFFGGGPGSVEHVGIVAGSGWMVDAPHTGAVVRFDRIAGFGNVVGVTSPGGGRGSP